MSPNSGKNNITYKLVEFLNSDLSDRVVLKECFNYLSIQSSCSVKNASEHLSQALDYGLNTEFVFPRTTNSAAAVEPNCEEPQCNGNNFNPENAVLEEKRCKRVGCDAGGADDETATVAAAAAAAAVAAAAAAGDEDDDGTNGSGDGVASPSALSIPISSKCLDAASVLQFLCELLVLAEGNADVSVVLINAIIKSDRLFPMPIRLEMKNKYGIKNDKRHLESIPITQWIQFSKFWNLYTNQIPKDLIIMKFNESVECCRWDEARFAIEHLDAWKYSEAKVVEFFQAVPNGVTGLMLKEIDDLEFKKLVIRSMGQIKEKEKFAAQCLKKSGLDLMEFPDIVRKQELNTIRYYLFSLKMEPIEICDLFDKKDSMLVLLADLLWTKYNYGRKIKSAIDLHYVLTKIQQKSLIPPFISSGFRATQEEYQFNQNYEEFKKNLADVPIFPPMKGNICPPSSQVLKSGCVTLEDFQINPNTDLVWVDSSASLKTLIDDIKCKTSPWVAVDSEWRPYSSIFGSTCVALLQLAVIDNSRKVYLIDMMAMGSDADSVLAEFFANKSIIKFGVYFKDSDWKEFQRRSELYVSLNSYNELHVLISSNPLIQKSFIQSASQASAAESPSSSLAGAAEETSEVTGQATTKPVIKSLARIAEVILNVTMDKSLQMANWESRPLLYARACYAALDVAVIVKIMQAIMDKTGIANLESFLYQLNSLEHHPQMYQHNNSSSPSSSSSSSALNTVKASTQYKSNSTDSLPNGSKPYYQRNRRQQAQQYMNSDQQDQQQQDQKLYQYQQHQQHHQQQQQNLLHKFKHFGASTFYGNYPTEQNYHNYTPSNYYSQQQQQQNYHQQQQQNYQQQQQQNYQQQNYLQQNYQHYGQPQQNYSHLQNHPFLQQPQQQQINHYRYNDQNQNFQNHYHHPYNQYDSSPSSRYY